MGLLYTRLSKLVEWMEQFLLMTTRVLSGIVFLGTLFIWFSIALGHLVMQPVQMLGMANAQALYQDFHPETRHPEDPNWDGALAGFMLGCSLSQSIPVVGHVLGPTLGLVIGYQVDAQT